MAEIQANPASIFMSPKKWRQVEKWVIEVGKHLAEGTLTIETVSHISKEYKMGDEPVKGSVRAAYGMETSSVAALGYQPPVRPSSAASQLTTFRPRSSMTGRSSVKQDASPSVAVVRPSPVRTPAKTEITRPNSFKDSGTSTATPTTRSKRCCCCCSNGSITANASPGGWVSPSVANTLQVNRSRAIYNHPVKSPTATETTPYDQRAFKLTYQHSPTTWRPETDLYGKSNGYPPWVTGASVVISANQIRGSPQIPYRSSSVIPEKAGTKWNGTRWVTETSNIDPVF